MYAADHRVFARLLMLREVDPEAVAPLARSLDDRAIGMASLAERLAAAGRLRPGLTAERAADVLWVLTSFWTFDELFSGRGLDADGCARILVEMARSTLLVAKPHGLVASVGPRLRPPPHAPPAGPGSRRAPPPPRR